MFFKILGGMFLAYLAYALVAGKIFATSRYNPQFRTIYRNTRPYAYWGLILLYLILGIACFWAK